jgi:hypothetical protein
MVRLLILAAKRVLHDESGANSQDREDENTDEE